MRVTIRALSKLKTAASGRFVISAAKGLGLLLRPSALPVVGTMAAHVLLPWIHRVFSNLKRLGLGVYHGFRKAHIHAYLDEFVFRWNRRRHYRSAFDTLLGIGLRTAPMNYRTLIGKLSPIAPPA